MENLEKQIQNLFVKQSKEYAEGHPGYPPELFRFISSRTPEHDLAWDAGTGIGQAAQSLAGIYRSVVATDTSTSQLKLAIKLPNIKYQQTSPTMSMDEVKEKVAAESSVDLVAVAQAVHFFDLPIFYKQVKWVLKKPHGIIAAWCYTTPEVNEAIDEILQRVYEDADWDIQRRMVDDKYVNMEFPFQPVDGANGTNPIRFRNERLMSLSDYFKYLRSWSAYSEAKEKGVDPLSPEVIKDFTNAWSSDGNTGAKVVNFPIYLRIGKVGHWKP